MNDLRERILNGSVNVFLMALPIALVMIFGEKFSLWINILAIVCLLFVSAILFAVIIGDDNEHPKRVLYALIGAAIALSLKVLAYPGHTVAIIITTILIICTADLINRGHVLCFRFFRSSRLNFLGKFILLATLLFIISLVIANFGSQKIWIPIVVASMIITLLFYSDSYLETREFDEDLVIFVSTGTLLLTGLISTIIQFSSVEIFWGIKLWEVVIVLVTLIIIAVISVVISQKRKRKAELLRARQENEVKQRENEEKSKQWEAEQKKIELEVTQKLEAIQRNENPLAAEDMLFLYKYHKELGAKLVFKNKINILNLESHITVSNHKKQVIWDNYLRDSFSLLSYASMREYDDHNLEDILHLTDVIRTIVSRRKSEEAEYEGEKRLETILEEIERAASPHK